MSLNLASIVANSCRHHPESTALVHDGKTLSYSELARHVEAFAAHLHQLGVSPGDNVALVMNNRRSFTIAYFGILHAGATVVPLSFLSVGREVAYALRDSEASALVAWTDYEESARDGFEQVDSCRTLLLVSEADGPLTVENGPAVDWDAQCDMALTSPSDTAVILYTSGTTGQPKGAELTHFNMYSNAQASNERLLSSSSCVQSLGPGHVFLSVLPLFHSFGQTSNQNCSVYGGAALSYVEKFSPEAVLSVMERDRVTVFTAVPTMYFQILNVENAERYDLSSLRYCLSGGAAMPVEVMKKFEERYDVKILEGYGLSETSPVATFNVLNKERKPGSIGEAIFGCEVKIFDDNDVELSADEVGEIVIRGYNVMKGYYNRPEATAEAFRNGWFHTGDMAKKDEDGYIFIVDRKKDLIIRGGFNVYPREVEEVLYSHPAVNEAAVIGVPDDRYGEEIKAYVALKAEADVEELRQFCKDNLAATKYPRLIEVLPELPKGSTGKILRKDLRALANL